MPKQRVVKGKTFVRVMEGNYLVVECYQRTYDKTTYGIFKNQLCSAPIIDEQIAEKFFTASAAMIRANMEKRKGKR